MTMTEQMRFKNLLKEFLNFSKPYITTKALEEIKRKYCYQIVSKRKISGIKDLEELIKVLEKYTIIFYDDIEPLHFINWNYLDNILQIKLQKYESDYNQVILPKNFRQNYNMYKSNNDQDEETCDQMRLTNSLKESSYKSLLSKTSRQFSETSYDQELKQMVLLKVYEKLGRSWKNICRHLGLKECEINEIEYKNSSNLKEQSYQALRICILQNNSDWKINLLHALEKGRRKDIKDMVEKILLNKT